MGMDVYGQSGNYFRRSVWGWRPLADYITDNHPDTAKAHDVSWHTNDGDGLNASQSQRLAEALKSDVADGTAAEYVAERDARLAAMPRVPCRHCNATGIRTDQIGVELGMTTKVCDEGPRAGQVGWCNGCSGAGDSPSFDTWYSLTVEDITEFANFLEACEGFEIC